ncbi:MAG: SDR family NAD(P)-dependent oxidoreductase [Candidatus Azotimanducaceae bacterium]
MKKTVLITGASSGIGESLAHIFARNDFHLIMSARDVSKLNHVKKSLRKDESIHIIPADLSNKEGAEKLIRETEDRGYQVDILVNNAAQMLWGNFYDHEIISVEKLIQLNISTPSTLTHHFLKGMINRGSGKILNVASIAGFQPIPSMGLYAASKAYVISFSESLAEQVSDHGISVTALCPGVTDTPATKQILDDLPTFVVSSSDEVAEEGYRALMAEETICIPGIANKAALTWVKFQPRSLIRKIGGFISRFGPNPH